MCDRDDLSPAELAAVTGGARMPTIAHELRDSLESLERQHQRSASSSSQMMMPLAMMMMMRRRG